MLIIICPKCGGTGKTEHNVGGHNSDYEIRKCTDCKGSGRLEEETHTTTKAFSPGKDKAERKF